jgi:putative ABC transport system substrate-binding protein
MNRRDLLVAAVCTAGSMPGGSQARNAARMPAQLPVVGFLCTNAAEATAPRVAAFRRGLGEAGYVDGQNIWIEFRWAEGGFARLPGLAADLVGRGVDVLATPGNTGAALAAKAATSSIPIVFGVSDDPARFGLVASLADEVIQ